MAAVPSDGWGQLLIYRKDLLDRAGLAEPRSLDDVRRAAARLDRRGMAGITLATGVDTFTAQSFEHVALAEGCQLVDDAGRVSLDSAACARAFAFYAELARRYSPGGKQDADSTRDTYFAQGALVGALRDREPVAAALTGAIHAGLRPDDAAAEAQRAVERLVR